MSFIYHDPNLLDQLVKQGLASEKKLNKKGQADPGELVRQNAAAVQTHIRELQDQIKPTAKDPNAPIEVATETAGNVDFNSSHMQDLTTLVSFLASNKITVDDKRVAYAANEKPEDPSYQFYKLQGGAGLQLVDRDEPAANGYYLNKESLIQYLNSLRGQLIKNPNPVMNAQVEAIIHQANDQLGTNMGKTYHEPAKTVAPTKIIDKVPQNIRVQYPTEEGNVLLSFGDISSDTAFNAWIQKNNISIDGRAYKHPQYDKCGLVRVLSVRAKTYLSNSASADDKFTYTAYSEQIPKLAQGLQCDWGGTAHPANQQGAGAGANTQQVATLQQLVESLPLQRDQLDFGKIRGFVNLYRNIVGSSSDSYRSQQASTSMDQLEQYMTAATQNTVGQSMTNFSMDGLTADDLISWSNPPNPGQPTRSRGSAKALSDYLEYIVRSVYTLVKDFYNSRYPQLAQEPQLLQAVEQQVGGRSIPFGSSTAASNLNNISTARARLPQTGT